MDGTKKEDIPLSEIRETAFRRGIGCVFIEYLRADGKWRILCRGDMQYLDFYAAAVREINKYVEGKEISYDNCTALPPSDRWWYCRPS